MLKYDRWVEVEWTNKSEKKAQVMSLVPQCRWKHGWLFRESAEFQSEFIFSTWDSYISTWILCLSRLLIYRLDLLIICNVKCVINLVQCWLCLYIYINRSLDPSVSSMGCLLFMPFSFHIYSLLSIGLPNLIGRPMKVYISERICFNQLFNILLMFGSKIYSNDLQQFWQR